MSKIDTTPNKTIQLRDSVKTLREMQRQIIHGKNTFGEIADQIDYTLEQYALTSDLLAVYIAENQKLVAACKMVLKWADMENGDDAEIESLTTQTMVETVRDALPAHILTT